MTTDGNWYNRPPRPFPVHVWLKQRYGFRLPPLRFAPADTHATARRPFPARVWLEQRRQITRL